MIQSLRENLSGAVAIILIGLIAIPLAFFGIESIFLNSTRVNDVATVNGEDISELELDRAVANQINQILSYLGADVDPSIIDEAAIRPVALDQLIQQKALLSKAKRDNLGVSDQFLGEEVRNMASFQIGGQFNEAVFRNFLTSYGYTPTSFADALTEEIVANQLLAGVRASAFATQLDLKQRVELLDETRSYQYFTIPEADVMASVEIPEEDVQAYYEFYQEDYREPEKVSINYVSLNSSLFMEETAEREDLSDMVLERFELLKTQQGDQRRVSHILFEARDGASVAEQVAEVQDRLALGESFADLASEFSADVGSANFGGDLGFTQGGTFPEAFEAAIADLQAGEITGPVETEAGTHLIQVTDVSEADFDIETQYASIELEIRNELAQKDYLNALDELRELAFSTDNLDELKDAFTYGEKLVIETTEPFTEDVGAGIATNAAVRAVAFSDVVLQSNLNSEVVELGESEAVVLHLAERTPSMIPPLNEVKDQIVEQLQREEAGTKLETIASALEAEIKNGATLDSVADREGYQWQAALDTPRGTAGDVGALIFSTLVDVGLPIVSGGRTSDGNYHVFRITDATAGQLENQSAEQLAQIREQVALERSEFEWAAYTASLEENADIDRKVDYSVIDTEI